ncbi:hypothetical protein DBV15_06044 [Temnothorax longispinosus]|uniref:Uncharacterized protein n=1 Tax=Temnothorax longispinosus TaxID=300112 RepID=A0A4S2L0B9_9HYME|nr:hypothetical protein DBV15_06044 [Temnothorax longispinosus]
MLERFQSLGEQPRVNPNLPEAIISRRGAAKKEVSPRVLLKHPSDRGGGDLSHRLATAEELPACNVLYARHIRCKSTSPKARLLGVEVPNELPLKSNSRALLAKAKRLARELPAPPRQASLQMHLSERNLGSGQPYPRLVPSSSSATPSPLRLAILRLARRATTPTSLIEFSSPVSCFLRRDGKRTAKSPPLEVSPAPADFYSSHTGFVYNFVPFVRSSRYAIDPPMYLRHFTLVLLFNPLTKTVFSSFAEASLHILRNNRESPYSIVSSRFCTLSRSGGDGVVVVIRDSLLYAVTWQARKGRLEIPARQPTWSVVLQFDAHAGVVENRNYHNDIHICRRIAGIPRKILLLPEIVNFA